MLDIIKAGGRRLLRVAGSVAGARSLLSAASRIFGFTIAPEYYLIAELAAPAIEKISRELLRKKKGDSHYTWIRFVVDIVTAAVKFFKKRR
jgi:hypothetical protein